MAKRYSPSHNTKVNPYTRTTDKESARNAHNRLSRVRNSEFRDEMREYRGR